MTNASSIAEILALYKRHGWILRRVLLSATSKANLASAFEELFDDVEVAVSPLDAAWFSRSSRPGSESWELRRLSETPFALVEVIDANSDPAIIGKIFRKTELRMLDAVGSKKRSN